jgi:short-subunit dehydrogenase
VRDRSVVVTGAAGGIGAVLARRFAEEGARVALLDRDLAGASARAAELEATGADVVALGCDVTAEEDCRSALAAVGERFGGVDVLVNNAGITHLGLFRDTDVAVLRRVMEVNFFGAVNCTKAALPSLLERRGRIVVLSSVAGFAPLATRTGYSASKHALHGFFESLRAEHLQDGLGVTMVCPYFVNTEIGAHALGPHGEAAGEAKRTGVRGAIEPEQVADAILRGVRRGQDRVLVPSQARLAWWISRLAPSLYEHLMARRVKN